MSIRVTDFPTGPPMQYSIPDSSHSIKEEIASLELYIQQLKTYQLEIKERPGFSRDKHCQITCNKENLDHSNSWFSLMQSGLQAENKSLSETTVPLEDVVIWVEDLESNVPNSPGESEQSDQSEIARKTQEKSPIHSRVRVSTKLRKLKTLVIPSKKMIISKHNLRKLELSRTQAQIARDHNYSAADKANVSIRHLGQLSWGKLSPEDRPYLCKLLNSFVNHCYSRQARRQILQKLGLPHSVSGIFNLTTDKFSSNRLNQIERTLDLGKTTCCHKVHLPSCFLAPVYRLKLPEYSKQCSKTLRESVVATSSTTPSPKRNAANSKVNSDSQNDIFSTRSLRRRRY